MNEYVPYEIARLLCYEKEFKTDNIRAWYNKFGSKNNVEYETGIATRHLFIPAPTYQSVFAWFRTYYIYAWIEPYSMDTDGEALDFKYCMFVGDNYEESNSNYHTFEEAENECIKYICKYYI